MPNQSDDLRRLFDLAFDLPPDQRSDALEEACGADQETKRRVLAMLAAAEDDAFLTAERGASRKTQTAQESAGQQIDRYRLLQEIGEGGFGTVWMAEQREPVKRRVALKIIKLGMDTRQVIARFEAERQALALMDHPNIAKVFDAGATETGRPYFVMEYIRGVPIVEYCDQQRLDTRARLALFMQVCHAIQHAHQKGVIHRDIKPNNVLVTLHDGVPVPKVIDFGIAKATNTELTQKTLFTEHRQLIGTPAYMSPEQAEMSGLDVDTRSDIYSLGVLLYELLTGTTPFPMDQLFDKGFVEMMRVIREEEPHKPSTRLSSLGLTASETAAQRQVDPHRLGTQLRGDLDWIVMKCLEKDRRRRYETATGLVADIQRHIDDEPVLAGPPTAGYKLSKFVRRNRATVWAGAAFAGLLVVALTTMSVLYQWAAAERDRAEQLLGAEQDRNNRALAAVTEMLSSSGIFDRKGLVIGQTSRLDLATSDEIYFDITRHADGRDEIAPRWVDASRGGDPGEEMVRLLSSEAVYWTNLGMDEERQRSAELEQVAQFQSAQLLGLSPQTMGVQMRRALLASVPDEERSALQTRLGNINFTNIALQALEERLFARTLTAIDKQFVTQPIVRARLLQTLASILRTLGLHEQATSPQQQALAIRQKALGPQHVDTLASQNEMGLLLKQHGRLEEARPHYEAALTGRRALLGPDHAATLESVNNSGLLLLELGHIEEAEDMLLASLDGRRRVLGPEHQATLESMQNLGALMMRQDRLVEAEQVLREQLEISNRVLGKTAQATMAACFNLGVTLARQNKRAEAERFLTQACDRRTEVLGDRHPESLKALRELARLQQTTGRYAEAERHLRHVLDARRETVGNRDPLTLVSMNDLAGVLRHRGALREADRLFRECLEHRRALLGDAHPDTLRALNDHGALLYQQGQLEAAERVFREVLPGRRRLYGPDHNLTLQTLSNLGVTLIRQGRHADAEPFVREAAEKRRAILGLEHPETLVSLGTLASLAEARSQFAEAEQLLTETAAAMRRELGGEHRNTLYSIGNLGRVLMKMDRLDEAEPHLLESLDTRIRVLGPEHGDTLDAHTALAILRRHQGRLTDAESILRPNLQNNRRVRGPDHESTLANMSELALTLALLGRGPEATDLADNALAGFAKQMPADHWRVAQAHQHRGRALQALERYEEASTEMLAAYAQLQRTQGETAYRTRQAARMLIGLYDAWHAAEPGNGHDETAGRWRTAAEAD